jgi:nucleoside 2-deoxyribosyltransferase
MKHVIYQAGPLFTVPERSFHQALSARLRDAGHEVIWPGDLLTDAQIESAGAGAPGVILETCLDVMDRCSCVVALLDGTQVDDGTAWEIGYACAKRMPVYGLRTDFRLAGDTPHSHVNSMIQASLTGFARGVDELLQCLAARK